MQPREDHPLPNHAGRSLGPIHRVLVPLDGSLLAQGVLPHAVALARTGDSQIVLLRVVGNGLAMSRHDASDAAGWRLEHLEAERYLADVADRLRRRGLGVECRTAVGNASEQILSIARAERIDLILLCTHGAGGLTGFHLSGTAAKVLSSAECSILLVPAVEGERPDAEPIEYTRVLVPVDGSKRSEWAATVGSCIARESSAEIVLLHVLRRPEIFGEASPDSEAQRLSERFVALNTAAARAYLEAQRESLAATGLSVRYRVEANSNVPQMIERVANEEGASLLVVSAHGYSPGTGRRYGAVTGALLAYGSRPVLVLQDLSRGEIFRAHPLAAPSARPISARLR